MKPLSLYVSLGGLGDGSVSQRINNQYDPAPT